MDGSSGYYKLNKIDREGANIDDVISDIKTSLTKDVINISDNLLIILFFFLF